MSTRRPTRKAADRLRVLDDRIELILTKGYTAVVDLADRELVDGHAWTALVTKSGVYAYRRNPKTGHPLLLHRHLTNAAPSLEVDHIDGNGLNNRRENLRVCTHKQNSRNARKNKPGSSVFKGVSRSSSSGWGDGKFVATIKVDGVSHALGYYDTEEVAARAYDCAARYLFGAFARTNFPGTEALSPATLRQTASRRSSPSS